MRYSFWLTLAALLVLPISLYAQTWKWLSPNIGGCEHGCMFSEQPDIKDCQYMWNGQCYNSTYTVPPFPMKWFLTVTAYYSTTGVDPRPSFTQLKLEMPSKEICLQIKDLNKDNKGIGKDIDCWAKAE